MHCWCNSAYMNEKRHPYFHSEFLFYNSSANCPCVTHLHLRCIIVSESIFLFFFCPIDIYDNNICIWKDIGNIYRAMNFHVILQKIIWSIWCCQSWSEFKLWWMPKIDDNPDKCVQIHHFFVVLFIHLYSILNRYNIRMYFHTIYI